MLTDEMDLELERLQDRALSCIYGGNISGRRMRAKAQLETLRQRRIDHCDRFAQKCLKNPRFAKWFPTNTARRSSRRPGTQYQETYARCDRLKNSPVFYLRRRLNGKPGKTYGLRYAEYRQKL